MTEQILHCRCCGFIILEDPDGCVYTDRKGNRFCGMGCQLKAESDSSSLKVRPLAEIEKGIERCQRALAFVAADVRPVYERRLVELEKERITALNAMQLSTRDGVFDDYQGPDPDGINRAEKRVADKIDGYDRDDLGESPDY